MNADPYITDYSQTYTEFGLQQSKLWPPNTLCMTIAGANTAKTAILKFEACFPDSIVGFIPDNKRADLHFVKYSLDLMKQRFLAVSRGATQDNLSLDKLLSFPLLTPPLPIQRQIAGILSGYDDLIENNQRRIKILEEMARSLYREWFVNFRVPGHEKLPLVDSPLGPIPKGWEVKPINYFGKVITGKTPSKNNEGFYGEDVPFVKTPDMHGNMFILSTNESLSTAGAESQANKTLPVGSICVSCIGTIGVVSITTEDCQTNQQINSVALINEAGREFLFLRLQEAKQTLENLGSTGATMGNVNKAKFEAMEIISPSAGVIVNYHRLVQPMFSEILTLSRQIQNLRRTRELLLPRLIEGSLELHVAEDYSAASSKQDQ